MSYRGNILIENGRNRSVLKYNNVVPKDYEIMPEEYFNGPQFNYISIDYCKELLKNDEVKAHFYRIDNGCIISLNTEKINSVITLKY